MSIGLCGAHRTGKTTLAELLATQTKKPFIKTTTSEIFRQNNLNPSDSMDFNTRFRIQKQILISYEEIWKSQPQSFVTDRTPIDLIAYTLADIQGSTQVNFLELERYIEDCYAATNKYFEVIVIVQPGIELTPAEGKAALNKAYIEHLNSLILGLCYDERLECSVIRIDRILVELEDRIRKLSNCK